MGKMTEPELKIWAAQEKARTIETQLTAYPHDPKAIAYCIDAAQKIQQKLAEARKLLS